MLELNHENYTRADWTGPRNPPAYDTGEIVNLSDIHLFEAGQPYDAYARLLEEAPVYWQDERIEGETPCIFQNLECRALSNAEPGQYIAVVNIHYPQMCHIMKIQRIQQGALDECDCFQAR